jgi:hypothetical protein
MTFKSNAVLATIAPMAPRHEDAIVAPIAADPETTIA